MLFNLGYQLSFTLSYKYVTSESNEGLAQFSDEHFYPVYFPLEALDKSKNLIIMSSQKSIQNR